MVRGPATLVQTRATLAPPEKHTELAAVMTVSTLQFLGGLVLLLIGGRLLVSASVDAATRLRVSPLVVGLTLVAWGTSAPEVALNLISAYKGRGDLALGNVVGANICNMALVLGLCALIKPLAVQERLINVEIWLNAVLLVAMATLGLILGFTWWKAAIMLGLFCVYSLWAIIAAMLASAAAPTPAAADTLGPDPTDTPKLLTWPIISLFFAVGLGMLSFGGLFASDGASGIALALGVPAAIVGVTIVSIGTTLPEMVTGVMAVRKGQTDLAIGNVVGSCLFNAGFIFGVTGLIAPPVADSSFTIPLAYMGLLAFALVPISRSFNKTVSRLESGLLLASYVGFLVLSALRVGG
jgi:cation:H+ antiporter